MGSPFKMNPKSPLMRALTGKQKANLPQPLQDAIKAAPESPARSYGKSPMKKTGGGDGKKPKQKTLADVKSGEYTNIRDYTPEELTAQVKERGVSSAQIKREVAAYRSKSKAEKSAAKNVTPSSGNQMASILAEGGAKGEKGIAEAAKRRSAGKSPAKMVEPKGKEGRLRAKKKRVGDKAMNFPGEKQVSEKRSQKLLDREEKIGKRIMKIRAKKSPAKMKGVKALKK